MKYFIYLCNVRTDLQIAKNRGGESPPDPKCRVKNKCHFRHTLNLIGSDYIRTMQENIKQRRAKA